MDRVKQDSAKTPAGTELPEEIHLVFDGPPGPECGRFVEAEDRYGRSINVGDWIQVGELWHLVIKPRWPTIATGKLPLFVEHQIHHPRPHEGDAGADVTRCHNQAGVISAQTSHKRRKPAPHPGKCPGRPPATCQRAPGRLKRWG